MNPGFDPQPNGTIQAVLRQKDGSWIVGGDFTQIGGTNRNYLARLLPNGDFDHSFQPGSLNGSVYALASQNLNGEEKILIGGAFSSVAGISTSPYFARLDSNGALDSSFDTSANHYVYAILVTPEGDVFAGGRFTSYEGLNYLVKVNPVNGSRDTSFTGSVGSWVWALAQDSEDKLVVGGQFTSPSRYLTRFDMNGTADITWMNNHGLPNNYVYALEVQRNGKVLVGGAFSGMNGFNYLARLLPDGSPDTTFDTGTGLNGDVRALALNPDGSIWVGGNFSTYQSVSVNYLTLLNGDAVHLFITEQPQGVFAKPGESVLLSAQAIGTSDISFQWYKNGSLIPSATCSNLTLNAITENEDGNYTLVVTNLTGGALTSQVARVDVLGVPEFLRQPVSADLIITNILNLDVFAVGTAPLSFQWWKDGQPIPSATGTNYTIGSVVTNDAGFYSVVVSNTLGVVTSQVAQVTVSVPPGGLDNRFPRPSNINNQVYSLFPFGTNSVLFGGNFSSTPSPSRQRLAIMNANGAVESGFSPNPNNIVYDAIRLDDGRILVGGQFTTIGGISRSYLAMLLPDGTVDPSFNIGTGPNSTVNRLLVLPNQQGYLIAGNFSSFDGKPNSGYLVRLLPDGSFDSSFTWRDNQSVSALAIHSSGDYLVGGSFTDYNSDTTADYFVRVTTSGEHVNGFATGFNCPVLDIVTLRNGSFIVSGGFSTPRSCSARFLEDGTLDSTWLTGKTFGNQVNAMAVTWDEKVYLVGSFTSFDGKYNKIVRIKADGTIDEQFDPGVAIGTSFSYYINDVAVNADGSVWIGGNFFSFAGANISYMALLNGSPDPLSITTQPKPVFANAGETVVMEAAAIGTSQLTYEWFQDGNPVPNSNTNRLVFSSVQEANDGVYTVRVSNQVSMTETSRPARLNVLGPPEILSQPIFRGVNIGQDLNLSVTAVGIAPLTHYWRKNGVILPGENSSNLVFQSIRTNALGNYDVVISNALGVAISDAIALQVTVPPSGTDPDFWTPGTGFNNAVWALHAYQDGRFLVGGTFTSWGGTNVSRLARFHRDGSLDTSFVSPNPGGTVEVVHVQRDGRILIGGSCSQVSNNSTYGYLARLNPDGSLDTNFIAGVQSKVYTIAEDHRGRILIGGSFTSVQNVPASYLVRLLPDGRRDFSFRPTLNGAVRSIQLEANHDILVAGEFGSAESNGIYRYITRYHEDGTHDDDYKPYPNTTVHAIQLTPEGNLLAVGSFTTVGYSPNNRASSYMARFLPNGDPDPSFAYTNNLNNTATEILIQPNGSFLVGGSFSVVAGTPNKYLTRFQPDGTPDTNFNSAAGGFDGQVNAVALTTDGHILVGGSFNNYDSRQASRFIRLNGDGNPLAFFQEPLSVFVNPGSDVELFGEAWGLPALSYSWLKNGSPVPDQFASNLVLFAVSEADDAQYQLVVQNGPGQSITSRVARVNVLGPPEFLQDLEDLSVNLGDFVSASVRVAGQSPLDFYWFRNGEPLPEFTSSNLVYAIARTNLSGAYHVVASNHLGTASSRTNSINIEVPPAGFNPDFNHPAAFNNFGYVYVVEPYPDGQFLLGGNFTSYQSTNSGRLFRYEADGSLDPNFQPANFNSTVRTVAKLPNGGLLVGGDFSQVNNNSSYSYLAKLLPDGSLDTNFVAKFNSSVNSIAVDSQGRILVGGNFTQYQGISATYAVRLLPDGRRDLSFSPVINNSISKVLVDDLDRVYLGGSFSQAEGSSNNRYLIRYLPNGSFDETYLPRPNSTVQDMALSGTDSLIVAGSFSQIGNSAIARNYLGKVNLTDGSADNNFNTYNSINSSVQSLDVDPRGNILIGGNFSSIQGTNANRVARLLPDGTLDPDLDLSSGGANSTVFDVAFELDGRLLIGGQFTQFNGLQANYFVRLNGTANPLAIRRHPEWVVALPGSDVLLSVEAIGTSTFYHQWLKDGTPLASQNSSNLVLNAVQLSDDADYSVVVTNLTGGSITSRTARVLVLSSPEILAQPKGADAEIGQQVDLQVRVAGLEPLSVQWRLNGQPISGANQTNLTLSSARIADSGNYDVVITNLVGGVTSQVAQVTVTIPPAGLHPDFPIPSGVNGNVRDILRLPDGRYYICGDFTTVQSKTRYRVARLHPDGTLDDSFVPPLINNNVWSMGLRSDGMLVIGGQFSTVAGSNIYSYVACLNEDGSLMTGFAPDPNSTVYSVAVGPQNEIYFGGQFSS